MPLHVTLQSTIARVVYCPQSQLVDLVLHCTFTRRLGHSASIERHYFHSANLPSFFLRLISTPAAYYFLPLKFSPLPSLCFIHLPSHPTPLYITSSIKSYHNHPVDQDRQSLSTLDLIEIFATTHDTLKIVSSCNRQSVKLRTFLITVLIGQSVTADAN
jgi:hypothetical protein